MLSEQNKAFIRQLTENPEKLAAAFSLCYKDGYADGNKAWKSRFCEMAVWAIMGMICGAVIKAML